MSIIASGMLLALLSGAVEALGLGGMRTQSALNQPFYAEIELHGVGSDQIDTITARLASREEFAKVGAERPHFLTRLQFSPVVGTDGGTYIQVSSREPIREPYIDFLVEVLWPQGRLVKEFTVLLDPPARGSSAPPQLTAPRTVAPRRRPPPALEPAPALRRSASAQRAQGATSQATPSPLPRPTPAPVPPQAQGTRFPLYYGPVARGASLIGIARAMTPPGASVEQTAMALFRNNQDAFIRGNINRLAVGADLVVPTAEELFALDQAAARRQFEDALAGRSVNTSPITNVPSDVRLRIAGADAASSAAASPAPAVDPALRDDLLMVQETTESNRQETAELRSRIGELEQQLADIQRLLQLRNEQLAQLQQSRGANGGAEARALPSPASPGSSPLAAAAADQSTRPDAAAAPADDSATGAVQLLPSASDRPPAEPIVEPGIGMVGPDGEVEAPLPAISSATADGAPADTMETRDDTSPLAEKADSMAGDAQGQAFWPGALTAVGGVFDTLPNWALAGAAGTLLLGGLGLSVYRRRYRRSLEDEAMETEGLPPPLSSEGLSEEVPRQGDGAAKTTEELSLDALPELESDDRLDAAPTSPGMDTTVDVQTGWPSGLLASIPSRQQETPEADVLAEADIYLLYGRYREAEALLREELQREPERCELRYKLAEALLGSGNRAGLAGLLEDMRAAGEDRWDAGKWANLEAGLAGLGMDADPHAASAEPMDGPGGATQQRGPDQVVRPDSAAGADAIGDIGIAGLGLSLDEAPSAGDAARPGPVHEQGAELDLDLDDLTRITAAQVGPGSAGLTLAEPGQASLLEGPGHPIGSLPEEAQRPALLPEPRDDGAGRALESGPGEGLADGGVEMERGHYDGPSAAEWTLDSGVWDETGTKLDLAKAYLEMEDPEAARAILDDVVKEGNEEQRAEAAALLAEIG